jgi:hypothetical protein
MVKRYRKIETEYITTTEGDLEDSPILIGDAHRIDEQLRCVIGDIMTAHRDRGFTDFKVVVYGRKE